MGTEFDIVNKQVIHDFPNGGKVVTDLRLKTVYVLNKKGDLIDKFGIDTMLFTEYTDWILHLEETL